MAEAILQRAREMARDDSWMERSSAVRSIVAELMWLCEQKRLEAARTTDPRITIDNEPYKRLEQESTCLYHGLWGAHLVDEPLYRREGVHNGPTIHPLDLVVGVVVSWFSGNRTGDEVS